MSTIEERVKKIVAEQLGVKEEEVVNTASFVEDLGADSLDTVELVMALEEGQATTPTAAPVMTPIAANQASAATNSDRPLPVTTAEPSAWIE